MNFTVDPLPFEHDALEPFVSARTVQIHHGKHHAGYVAKLDRALGDDPLREKNLTDIMLSSSDNTFNLAAQVWNHDFYWQSLTPEATHLEAGTLAQLLDASFGSMPAFKDQFAEAAANEFGSGWTWLVYQPAGQKLETFSTTDAVNPLTSGRIPLLTLDVWEHAYYLDYQNNRGAYIKAFLDGHINWRFASANLTAALA